MSGGFSNGFSAGFGTTSSLEAGYLYASLTVDGFDVVRRFNARTSAFIDTVWTAPDARTVQGLGADASRRLVVLYQGAYDAGVGAYPLGVDILSASGAVLATVSIPASVMVGKNVSGLAMAHNGESFFIKTNVSSGTGAGFTDKWRKYRTADGALQDTFDLVGLSHRSGEWVPGVSLADTVAYGFTNGNSSINRYSFASGALSTLTNGLAYGYESLFARASDGHLLVTHDEGEPFSFSELHHETGAVIQQWRGPYAVAAGEDGTVTNGSWWDGVAWWVIANNGTEYRVAAVLGTSPEAPILEIAAADLGPTTPRFLTRIFGVSNDGGCSGGGEIVTVADPVDGDPFDGRTVSPRAWLTVGFDDQDRSFALDAGNHTAAFDGRKVGNIISFGTISRALSDRSSPYKMASCQIEVDDSARLLASLEAAAASEHWANREVRIRLADRQTIEQAGTPWTLFRGILRNYTSDGLKISLEATSVLGSEFSDFNLERTIPSRQIKDDFPEAPKDQLEKYVPIAYGAYPDRAYSGVGPEVTNVTVVPRARPSAPTGLTATIVPGGGALSANVALIYAVSAFVGGLESEPSYVSIITAADQDAVRLNWDAYSGATNIAVYVSYRSDFLQFSQLHTALAAGATTLTDPDGSDLDRSSTLWKIGLRMNVTWFVFPVLADGSFRTAGRSVTQVYTPIMAEMRRRDVDVSWGAYTGAVKYYVMRYVSFYSNWSPRYDLQIIVDAPATTAADVANDDADIPGGYDEPPGIVAPELPTGCVPAIPCGKEAIDGKVWQRLLICGHAIRHVEQIYRSKVTSGTDATATAGDVATYELVASADYGTRWLAPGQTGWPFTDNYRAVNGRWYTLIYTDLDPLPDTILVNLCGLEDQGDGTGLVIDGAARQVMHLLQNFILPPADAAWTAGAWLSARTFTDGTPVVNTGSLAALEAIETARIGRPYRGQIYLDQPIALRDLLGRLYDSFGMRFGENEHGQVIVVHLDEFADLSAAQVLTDARDLIGNTKIERRLQELENEIPYSYGYRPARDGQFLKQTLKQRDAVAIADNRGHVAKGELRQMYYVDDPLTADDVIGRELSFGNYPPRYVTMPCILPRIDVKLGAIPVVTDFEGIGATGWVRRPLLILGSDVTIGDLTTAPQVVLTGVDILRCLGAFGVWATDEIPDWASASDDERANNFFWADDTDRMSDGAAPKVWG